jgi:uncharacterized protein
MRGLVFEQQAMQAAPAPNRADVACFVGFVARRPVVQAGRPPSILPRPGAREETFPLYRWFVERGFAATGKRMYDGASRGLAGPRPVSPEWMLEDADLDQLLDVPVPIESWEDFDRLFAWERRPMRLSAGEGDRVPMATTYLGAAVRSFFAQGGRTCYVVRVGDPWPYDTPAAERREQLAKLIPGFPASFEPSQADRASWKGVGHLFGLPEVSFLCLPDLADVVAADLPEPPPPPIPPAGEEVFLECTDAAAPDPGADPFIRGVPAPRSDEAGYLLWASAIRMLGTVLQQQLREVQLVSSIPLPLTTPGDAGPEENLFQWMRDQGWLWGSLNSGADRNVGRCEAHSTLPAASIASSFIQLAWPWIKTFQSREMPEELEGPDAILVGVLARNALRRGCYRSAAGLRLAQIFDGRPLLRGEEIALLEERDTLCQRVSLLGRTPRGMEVLSDVTTACNESYRQAHVNRLVSAIVRAARTLGEQVTFEPSGPRLWNQIRGRLTALLDGLWRQGALRGETASDAYSVRCDKTTMSERDIDAGRVLVEVKFEATASIERIAVVLAMSSGGVSAERVA